MPLNKETKLNQMTGTKEIQINRKRELERKWNYKREKERDMMWRRGNSELYKVIMREKTTGLKGREREIASLWLC